MRKGNAYNRTYVICTYICIRMRILDLTIAQLIQTFPRCYSIALHYKSDAAENVRALKKIATTPSDNIILIVRKSMDLSC